MGEGFRHIGKGKPFCSFVGVDKPGEDCYYLSIASVYQGQYGQKWLICVPAALLSLRVRPVRVVQVPCRNANHHIFDSATSALRILPGFQADEGGVLDVR